MPRVALMVVVLVVACGGDDGAAGNEVEGLVAGTAPAAAGSLALGGTGAGPAAGTSAAAGQPAAGVAAAGTPAAQAGVQAAAGSGAGLGAAGAAAAGTPAGAAAAGVMAGAAAAGSGVAGMGSSAGPVDGDPSKPMVEVPGVPCGTPNVSFLGIPQGNLVDIGGREVFVAYPCAHEGASVTFFLFIHGTLGEGMKIPFTMTSFPIHTKVDADNFIVVTPQAVGSQWGRSDGGADLPHLHEVIDWVYAPFGERFNIRSMWASGGSWGAFYLSTFACDAKLEGRLNGVRMVVGGGCPRCSDDLACVVAQQELELGMGSPLSDAEKEQRVMAAGIENFAQMHGCDARVGPMDLGTVRAWTWPNCDDGYAHSYYLGPGEHADSWGDPVALDYMVEELKSIDR